MSNLDLSRYEGHTPGPWADYDMRRGPEVELPREESMFVASEASDLGSRRVITRIRNEVSKLPLDDSDAANARLIADAPALLAEVVRLRAERDALRDALTEIGDFAHDRSTGPAVPDALWDVRIMAYAAAAGGK